MIQVSSPNKFPDGCHITFFTGKNIEDAIQLAKEWAEKNNIEAYSYYPQKAFGKSILVSYKRNEDENEKSI